MKIEEKKEKPTSRLWIIYCRVSRKKQMTEHFWLESQEAACCKYAEREDIKIYKIIRDGGISWATLERDGLKEVFEILKKENKNKVVITDLICLDQSRLSRNDKLAESLINADKIRAYGAKIDYVMYPVDADSSMGQFMEQIMYSIAALERRNTAEKSLAGCKRRLREWYRPFPTVPAGFKREGTGKEKKIIIDPFKGPILKKALEMYANGVIISDAGFFTYLKEQGFTSNKGKMFASILEFMFTEERLQFYAGYVLHPRRGVEEPLLGKHPALISLETVAKIKKRRDINPLIGRTKEDKEKVFPLKGLVTCPHCGQRLTAYFAKGKRERYPYYGCQNKRCNHRFCINANTFHEDFHNFIDSIKISKGMIEILKLFIMRLWDESQRSEEARVGEIKNRVKELDIKQQKIIKTMANVTVPEIITGLQEEWDIHSANKIKLMEELESYNLVEKKKLNDLIDTSTELFISPQKVFDLGNKELQKIVVSVLWGKQIFYSKEQKARTPEKSLLNQVLSTISYNVSQVSPLNEKNGLLEHHFSQLLYGNFLDEYASNNFI